MMTRTRNSPTMLQNSLHLPAEVWANVILHIDDNKDVAALARTCRVTQREAERALYRHLSVNKGSLLLEQRAILPPHLSDHVQSLYTESEIPFDPAASQENDKICQGLARLRKLKSLNTCRATYLKTNLEFPFCLVEFITWSDINDIKLFFASQPSIKSLWWSPRAAPVLGTDKLEDDTLPSLHTLQTDSNEVMSLLLSPCSRRRVTGVAIGSWYHNNMLPTFQCSFVQALRFPGSLSVVTTLQIESIFPNLSFLECHVHFNPVRP